MSYKYSVEVLELQEVHELPDAWTNDHFRKLLEHIDYDDIASIPPEELKDMAALALSDLEPEEAAVKVLEFRFGEQLSKGQRQNISEELKDERLWEEYAEISLHEELFNVSCMLYWAFPKEFSEPDIVRIKLKVNALTPDAATNLHTPRASFIARLLNDGMNEHNTIYRLFDDKMATDNFPESAHIIWQFEVSAFNHDEQSANLTIFTAWNWVDELKGVKSYESTAFSDGQLQ